MPAENPVKIYIVEDDPLYLKFLDHVISLNPDHEIKKFTTGNALIEAIHEKPSIITLDYTLPDISGEEVLRQVKEFDPNIPVIIISGQQEIGIAVQLLKLGAYDYIGKDEETKERLNYAITNAKRNVQLINEINSLKKEISSKYEFEKSLVGNSPAIKQVFELMQKAVNTNITVSITGETGTGKELVAKAIHYNSRRRNNAYIPVNIAAVPRDLIESELFGHEKGSFTGAISRRIGKFEEASGGTIFLDEIAEMDLNLQAKLLRVIQEKEVTRVGGNQIIPVDSRILAATHKDLSEEVKKGNFRQDLYYRLLGLPINIPPLRERGNDILILAKHFLDLFCVENDMEKIVISGAAKEKLLKYSYPGNVRELKSIMELAAVMGNNVEIKAEDINFPSMRSEDKFTYEELTLKEYNHRIIDHFLNKHNQDVLKVAAVLDIGKSTIYRYLKEKQN
ncbi:MAG: sigma-54-dependent Fis family transcriptional regulator [Cyclobacteriaceae bacterium]|nr:sigma-54-dependent Fis family transcriptional regulator [Cyclobacteriaceae bacterium]